MTTLTKNIRYRPATDINEFESKRVAVYARVSREGEEKHHSIEMQMGHLKNEVESHFGWQFAGYYVDEGITGTKTDRPALNRLMQAARNGEIDIILTKSVSRLGRNTIAVQRMIRELRSLGVTVIFDKENINTLDPESTLYLNLLGVQAEVEAKQTSDNVHWSIVSRFNEGIPTYSRPYGYYMKNQKFYVIPEEAAVVKRIFDMYLSGMGRIRISKQLNLEGVPTLKGAKWSDIVIREILINEKYIGNLLLQKWYTPNFLTKIHKANRGEVPQYLVENAHEPIIDEETFNKVQIEMARRAKIYGGANKRFRKPQQHEATQRIFNRLIRCSNCNKYFGYKKHTGGGYIREVWECYVHLKQGKSACPVKGIREDILIEATRKVLIKHDLIKEDTELTNSLLKTHIKQIIANPDQTLEYHLHNGAIVLIPWQYKSRRESWTPEMKQRARKKQLQIIEARKGGNHAD